MADTVPIQAKTVSFQAKTASLQAKIVPMQAKIVPIQANAVPIQAKTVEIQAKTVAIQVKTVALKYQTNMWSEDYLFFIRERLQWQAEIRFRPFKNTYREPLLQSMFNSISLDSFTFNYFIYFNAKLIQMKIHQAFFSSFSSPEGLPRTLLYCLVLI